MPFNSFRSLCSLASGLPTSSSFFASRDEPVELSTSASRYLGQNESTLLSQANHLPSVSSWLFGKEKVKVRREREDKDDTEYEEAKPSSFMLTLPSLGSGIFTITNTLSLTSLGAIALAKSKSSHELKIMAVDVESSAVDFPCTISAEAIVSPVKAGSCNSSPSSMRAVFEMEFQASPSPSITIFAPFPQSPRSTASMSPGSPKTPQPILKEDIFYSPSPSSPTHIPLSPKGWLSPGPVQADFPPVDGHAVKQMVINGRQYRYRRCDEGGQVSIGTKKRHTKKPTNDTVLELRSESHPLRRHGSGSSRTGGVGRTQYAVGNVGGYSRSQSIPLHAVGRRSSHRRQASHSSMKPSASILMNGKQARGPKPAGPRIRFAETTAVERGHQRTNAGTYVLSEF